MVVVGGEWKEGSPKAEYASTLLLVLMESGSSILGWAGAMDGACCATDARSRTGVWVAGVGQIAVGVEEWWNLVGCGRG